MILAAVAAQQYEEQQDPVYARFDQLMTECASSIVNAKFGGGIQPGQPSPALCYQEIDRGLANWCGPVGTANYHEVKCKKVQDAQQAFDIVR